MSKQILSKTPTELPYIERSVFVKGVNNQNLSSFELGCQESLNVSVWIIVGFQRSYRHSQNLNNDTFCRLPVTSAQCVIGKEKYPDAGIFFNCDDDDCSQVYGEIIEVFRALTKDDILQPYIPDHDFSISNIRVDDVGYSLYFIDIRSQQIFTASRPIEVEFKFDGVVRNDINGYALVLTNRFVSVSSDGQRHYDLI